MQLIKTSKLPEILGLPLFSQVVFVVRQDVDVMVPKIKNN